MHPLYWDGVACFPLVTLYGFSVILQLSSTASSFFIHLDKGKDYILISSDEELSLALSNSHEDLFHIFVLLIQDYPQGHAMEKVCCLNSPECLGRFDIILVCSY